MNRLLVRLLDSPVSGAVDASLLALTLTGRRTGRTTTFPVQYAAGPDALWVWPGHQEAKTWWRNLADETPVGLRLRGESVAGLARAVGAGVEANEARRGLESFAARFPRTAPHLDHASGGDPIAVRPSS